MNYAFLPTRSSVIGILALGCHHRPALEPVPVAQAYCWWSSQYASVAPVWIASRFQESMAAAGFPNSRARHDGDSAWATADLARFADSPAGMLYRFRVVAHPANDETGCAWRGMPDAPIARRPTGAESCFHTNLVVYHDRRAATPSDTNSATSYTLPLCGKIYGAALGGLELLK